MNLEHKAIGFGLAAVFCWSTVATAFKIALSLQSVAQLVFVASCVSVVVLATVLATQGRLSTALLDLRHNWPRALLCALLNPLLYYFVLLSAYERLPAQVAQPINYTWAIVLSVLAVPFLGQTLRRIDLIALGICYSGVVIISLGAGTSGGGVNTLGLLLALSSTLIWAAYWIINSRDQRAPTPALLQNFLCALPIAAALAWPLPWNAAALLAGVWVGLFEMGLAFLFWLQAMKLTRNTSRIGNLIFLSPFLSLILIHYVLGEDIHLYTYLGLCFIVLGIALQNSGTKGSRNTK